MRWQAKGREIGSDDGLSGKATVLHGFPVIRFRQRAAGDFEGPLLFRSERRDHMREDQILCACPFGHRTEIESIALTKIGVRKEPAALVRPHGGMNRGMHDHIGALGQPLDLFGCRRRAWRQRHIIAGIAADHHAAGRRVHAIRGMAGNMRGADGADFDIARRPHGLRLVFCFKGDRVDQFRGATGGAIFDLRMALGDFTRLNKEIRDVRGEFPAADGETQCRHNVRRAAPRRSWVRCRKTSSAA